MASDLQPLLDFLSRQKVEQLKHFPTYTYEKILSFLATTSLPGSYATVGVVPVGLLEPAGEARDMTVHLHGPLPRTPTLRECVTIHVTNPGQYQGYQIKTRPLSAAEGASALYEVQGGKTLVKGHQIFTVHHSPYTMKFFEQIPFDEVQQIVGSVPYALVAIGETANVSPRFVYHVEVKDDRPVLYHGDGLALKTYMNLKLNRSTTRIVVDLDTWSGWSLQGTTEEFHPHQNPEAHEKIAQGFLSGNWGKPSRLFRFVADRWEPLAPTGPAVKR